MVGFGKLLSHFHLYELFAIAALSRRGSGITACLLRLF
nr:MAG TPA: hypothetical protein [Caudoviricetes sp.]